MEPVSELSELAYFSLDEDGAVISRSCLNYGPVSVWRFQECWRQRAALVYMNPFE